MTTFNFTDYIKTHTLRLEATHRGGGIEIDASAYLNANSKWPLKMTAYQNYLGGGMLGSVQSSIEGRLRDYPKSVQTRALKLADALKRYYHDITNEAAGEYDDYAGSDYDANQNRPGSAY